MRTRNITATATTSITTMDLNLLLLPRAGVEDAAGGATALFTPEFEETGKGAGGAADGAGISANDARRDILVRAF